MMTKHATTQRNEKRKRKQSGNESSDASREKCDVCGQSFSCVGNLNRHKKLHTEYERLQCNVCLRTCSNLTNFKIHIPGHHSNSGLEISYSSTTEGATATTERQLLQTKNDFVF